MMNITFEFDDREIQRNIAVLDKKTQTAIKAAFAFQAGRSTAWMKTNAPWTDRTSAARNGLHATPRFSSSRFELLLAHAVSYGIWLEVANSGRYQIILPALRQAAKELQGLLDNLWGKM